MQEYECGRYGPALPLSWGRMGKGGMSSTPEAGERAGPVVVRVGELLLSLTSCSLQEGRTCTLPGQHNRANPEGEGVGEPAVKL